MVKEPKNIDFYTSGKEISEQDFARISKWIKSKVKVRPISKRRKLLKTITVKEDLN